MPDRRRAQRWVLGPPLPADAMPMEDVVVERMTGDRMTIVSLTPHEAGEDLLIHLSAPEGLQSHRARVTSSTPITAGSSVQFRLELHLRQSAGEGTDS